MTQTLEALRKRVGQGDVSRREFMSRTAAMGISATAASSLFATSAMAGAHEAPVKGGTIKMGTQGGEATNGLDPALAASDTPVQYLRLLGDTLVRVTGDGMVEPRLAESIESSADAKTWRFKIRKEVEFHNGKTMTPADVVATIERHSDEEATSGALGIVKGISSMSVDGDTVVLELDTPNADLPYLMADYHLLIHLLQPTLCRNYKKYL